MKSHFKLLILFSLIFAGIIIFNSCSELKDGSTNVIDTVHPESWMEQASDDFHARKVGVLGLVSCTECHGDDYRGGESEVSCYVCHGHGHGPSGHPDGWMTKTAAAFHGEAVAEGGWQTCAECHGADYQGGVSEKSCYTCHNGPSGHPTNWLAKDDADFHARKVGVLGISSCARCHGVDYRGGKSSVSCYTCHTNGPSGHPANWLVKDDIDFHGQAVIDEGWLTCTECHGEDYQGGTSEKSCYACHNGPSGHPVEWNISNSQDFHGIGIQKKGWDLSSCQICHGQDYSGGGSGASCLTCHTDGPEACNTCHGSSLNSAPPKDLTGNTDTKLKTVGAHQAHLTGIQFSDGVECAACHIVPASLYSEGHIDSDLPAEVVFGAIATDNGTLMPVWDGINSCSTVFCHGGFAGGNDIHNPDWTIVGGNEAMCGTCHGLPPKEPHTQEPIETIRKCHICHSSVIDENYNIIDKQKHINGVTDY